MSYLPYPDIEDKDFLEKLHNKYEFIQNNTDTSIKNQTQEEACNQELFKLFKHQRALKNFFNPLTPYRSLLLINSLGTGKTCSSITIAESHKKLITSSGQKIIVLLEDSVKENYINEIYNPDKDSNQCIGNTYMHENRKNVLRQIKNVYDIITIGTFVNWVNKMTIIKGGYEKIKQKFSNTLIIVDEVHNIREQETNIDDSQNLKRYDAFAMALSLAENSKVLLMSATPMFDNSIEIVSLINLFKLNEKESSKDITKGIIKVEDIFNSKGNLKKSGKDIILKELKGRVSYVGQNPITFPKFQFAPDAKTLDLFNILKIIDCPMSESHYNEYLSILDQPIINIRQISNFMQKYDKKSLSIEELLNEKTSVSTKMGKLLQNIIKNKGTSFVYSEFISFGGRDIKEALMYNGFTEYNENNENSGKSFIVLEGGTDSNKRQKLLRIFNSKENKDGSLIKVVIGSKVMKEGISLKNVRSVHIFEPWFNVSRLKQVWGRAIRSCSHLLLKPSERLVNLYLYASTFPEKINMEIPKSFLVPFSEVNTKISQNLYAYKLSEEKEIKIQEIVNILREIAIDCNLHKDLNNNVVDGIKCDIPIKNIDKTTYNLDKTKFNEDLVNYIIKVIKREIKKTYNISISKLLTLKEIKDENIDINLIKFAINSLITDKNDHFLQIKDKEGYIILKGNYLIFQPLDNESKRKSKREVMSMFERINSGRFPMYKNIPYEKIIKNSDNNKSKKEVNIKENIIVKEVKVLRDDKIINNIQGILKNNGDLLLLQQSKGTDTIDQRKKSRGRVCKTFNGPDMLNLVKNIGIPKEQYETYFIQKGNTVRVKEKDTLCIIIRDFFYPDLNFPSPISSNVVSPVSSVSSSSSRESASKTTKVVPKKSRKAEKSIIVKEIGNYKFKMVEIDGNEIFKIGNKNITDRGSKNCSVKRKEDLIIIANELNIPTTQRMTRNQLCNVIRNFVFKKN